jgi:hypothetical protein
MRLAWRLTGTLLNQARNLLRSSSLVRMGMQSQCVLFFVLNKWTRLNGVP